jgi:dCTP deaminase
LIQFRICQRILVPARLIAASETPSWCLSIPVIPTSTRGNHSPSTIEIEDGEAFMMQPGEFALASTMESLTLPDNLLARLEGRSSIARLGITVHSTAAVFEPGWEGTATMELSNLGRMAVALYPGMRICSFTFQQLLNPAQVPYSRKENAKYAGQHDPRASRLAEEAAAIRRNQS